MSVSLEVNPNAGKQGDTGPAIIKPDSLFPLARQIGYFLSLILIRMPISANQVTFISMLIGLAGCALFLKGELAYNLCGGLLLVLSYALDYSDGVIARLKDQCSPFGAAFDDFVDWLIDTTFFACLGYGVWVSGAEIWWLWLGLIAAGGSTIDYIIDLIRVNRFAQARKVIEEDVNPKQESEPELGCEKTLGQKLFYIFHTLSRAEFCSIILALSAFDVVWVLLPFGAIGAQAFWLGDLFRKRD